MMFLASSAIGAALIVFCSFIRPNADKYHLCVAAGLVIFSAAMTIPMEMLTRLTAHPIDAALYRADVFLGLDPLPLARLILSMPAVYAVLTFAYLRLPIFLALAYGIEGNIRLVKVAAVAPMVAFLFYGLFPAVGPAHIFSNYPQSPPDWMANLYSPRDCFPSMHLGWALIIAFNVRARWLRFSAWIYAGIMAVATVGLGEHYYIDLIASVPFCAAIQFSVANLKTWLSRKTSFAMAGPVDRSSSDAGADD